MIFILLITLSISCHANDKSNCSSTDIKKVIHNIITNVKSSSPNKLLKNVSLPLLGSEFVVGRYDDKGINLDEFIKNYKKIFPKATLDKLENIKTTDIKITKENDQCKINLKLHFEYEQNDSQIIYQFKFFNNNLKLYRILIFG